MRLQPINTGRATSIIHPLAHVSRSGCIPYTRHTGKGQAVAQQTIFDSLLNAKFMCRTDVACSALRDCFKACSKRPTSAVPPATHKRWRGTTPRAMACATLRFLMCRAYLNNLILPSADPCAGDACTINNAGPGADAMPPSERAARRFDAGLGLSKEY